MAKVRMLVSISGGRGDGSDWPGSGGIVECGDAEASDLCLAGHAERLDVPQEAAAPAQDATEAPEPHDEPSEPEEGSDGDADGGQPRVRDPKEVWETFAMEVHGLDVNAARSMSKADLIASFRNPA